MSMRWSRAVVVTLCGAVLGCPLGGAMHGPCAQDSLACSEGPAFELDEDCELDGDLAAVLGQGGDEFVVLLPGGEPSPVAGPQGSGHLVLALRVDNPDAEHLTFEVEIDLETLEGTTWEDVQQRKAVYSGSVVRFDGSAADLLGIVMVPGTWSDGEDRRINVDIRDSCGRAADLIHVVTPESSGSSGSGSTQ